MSDHVLVSNVRQQRTTIVEGDGVFLYDDKGKEYLDAVGGVGVVNIGHGVKTVLDAIAAQARTLTFTYGSHIDNAPRAALAEFLNRLVPRGMGETRTLFCSGGAEANEAALKLAYQYHWEKGHPTKRKLIGRWQSYHGNTVGALSMSGRTSWRRMHDPLLLDFPHIPPPYCYRCPWRLSYPECRLQCAEELRRVIIQEGPENIAAFIAEPVIGTSMSAVVPPAEYYSAVRRVCDEFDVLFIADEVMSGIGRTGLMWGIDHWNVVPDIITAAKGIAGGYASLGATILAEKVWKPITEGTGKPMHSYTYGGNPLSCAAGLAVLRYIEEHELVARAAQMGEELVLRLHRVLDRLPWVGDIRGKGLFIGIEIVMNKENKSPFPPAWDMTHRIEEMAFKSGLLILGGASGLIDGVSGDHFELLPPYTIEEPHLDFIANTICESVEMAVASTKKCANPLFT